MLEKYQLRNGMKVILSSSKKSPVVTVQAWVKTGSADERVGEEGISHFIEHLLFKGTRKYKVGEIASIIEGSGGELNAYTSFDQTVFHITISKHFQETAFDALSEMIGYPNFDPTEIDNEREVVVEEIKRSNDNPHRVANRLLFEGLYKKHPYRKPVIGYEENVRTFSTKMIQSYYRSRYSPQNMCLVVVGDFEDKTIKKLVDLKFGSIQKSALRKITRPHEPAKKNQTINVGEGPFQETIFHAAWPIPNVKHADTPALDVLALILGQGDSSRLTQKARLEKPVVNYVGAHAYTPQDGGFFGITAGLNEQNLEEFLTLLGEELLRLQLEGVTEGELKKAITLHEADEIYGVETVDGLARKLGTFELLFSKPDFYIEYLNKVKSITASDVCRVARKYLTAQNMTLAILTNGKAVKLKEDAQKFSYDLELAQDALRKVRPSAKPEKMKMKAPNFKITSGVQEIKKTDISGINTIIIKNTQAPTVSLRVAFRGGQRTEPKGKDGLAEFLSSVWMAGAGPHSEAEIIEKLDAKAMSIRPFAGRNTIGLSLTCLEPHIEEGVELFSEILKAPKFTALERERVVALESIKQKNDNPALIAIQNFQEKIFKGHPYAKDPSGNVDTITHIVHEDIEKYWKRHVTRANATMAVAGSVSMSEIEKLLNKTLSILPEGVRFEEHYQAKPLTADEEVFHKLDKEQSHLVYGMKGITIYDENKYVLQVLQSVLAGQGGRLFLELRDKASLAYSVSPIQTDGIDAGYFGAYIGCSPEKARKALEMMQIEFKKLAGEKISTQELERAKRYLIGKHDIGLQKNSSLASATLFEEVYGLSYKDVFSYPEKIESVTQDNVLEMARNLFSQPRVTSVVGPQW